MHNAPNVEKANRWPQTLRAQLGSDFEVFIPSMPNSENARYEEWKIWFERHFEFLRDDIILICWSQGGMFITKYLSENKPPFSIKALFLVASPFDFVVTDGCREDGGDFYADVKKIKLLENVSENIFILHSRDDFVVPYEHALKFKKALTSAMLVTFEDKNHFLVEELPELVGQIKRL